MDTWGPVGTLVLMVVALALFVAAAWLTVRLVQSFRELRRQSGQEIPLSAKLTFWAALVYALFPADLLPDPVYLDDIAVLLAALHHLRSRAGRPEPGPAEPGPAERG